jgi:hypothetical protein
VLSEISFQESCVAKEQGFLQMGVSYISIANSPLGFGSVTPIHARLIPSIQKIF